VAAESTFRSIADYEDYCRREVFSPGAFAFSYGAYNDPNWTTNTNNVAGFLALKLRPRVLVDGSDRNLSTTVLGQEISFPIAIGPAAEPPHLEAELAAARAAGKAKTLMVLECHSTYGFEDVAANATGPRWYQMYVHKDRDIDEFLVRRAYETGYSALMLTVDNVAAPTWRRFRVVNPAVDRNSMPISAWSRRHSSAANLAGLNKDPVPSLQDLRNMLDSSVSWSDVDWLRSIAKVPIVVKGIQTAEDARLCAEHGVDGLVVSNHGGRFQQGARGTIEALPEIVDAVGDRLEVYLDGGIRLGTDVLKALALGARAVFIGRAYHWGLAAEGEVGVSRVLEILRYELESAMGLCGVSDIRRVDRSLVAASVPSTIHPRRPEAAES
jgi:isopentenyl diphosphate isomerase/L-lactate dehydrogenase-like FMN-dependent dehydrogenase